jgi:ribosomal protein S18 acetylase RimI-like enzyme
MKIRKMLKKDINKYIECQTRIWETLRDHLPEEYIDRNLNWINRQGVRDAWVRVIDEPNWVLLLAEEGDSIVGIAYGHVDWSRLSNLEFLGVVESQRRRGIARSLMEKFIKESKTMGATKITLNTSPTLKPAVKLYTDMDFVPEGFLRRHRFGVDLIIFSKFMETNYT